MDEENFFSRPRNGGTVVRTRAEEMIEIVRERYPRKTGTSSRPGLRRRQLGSDRARCLKLLTERSCR